MEAVPVLSRPRKLVSCPVCRATYARGKPTQIACSLDCTARLAARAERRESAKRGRLAKARLTPGKSVGNIAFFDSGKDDARSPVWRTEVDTSYGPAAWVSVTRAKPLSALERGALALWSPADCIGPIPGRRAAIRAAVALELGNRDFVAMPEEAAPQPCPKHMVPKMAGFPR
jgi:hypothetical protein